MEREELRQTLAELEMSQGALARLFIQLGDTAAPLTVRRRVERWCQGGSNVPGEAAAFLNLLKRYPKVLADLRRNAPQPQGGRHPKPG